MRSEAGLRFELSARTLLLGLQKLRECLHEPAAKAVPCLRIAANSHARFVRSSACARAAHLPIVRLVEESAR